MDGRTTMTAANATTNLMMEPNPPFWQHGWKVQHICFRLMRCCASKTRGDRKNSRYVSSCSLHLTHQPKKLINQPFLFPFRIAIISCVSILAILLIVVPRICILVKKSAAAGRIMACRCHPTSSSLLRSTHVVDCYIRVTSIFLYDTMYSTHFLYWAEYDFFQIRDSFLIKLSESFWNFQTFRIQILFFVKLSESFWNFVILSESFWNFVKLS